MTRKVGGLHYRLIVTLALLGGFVGGTLSSRLFAPSPAVAQPEPGVVAAHAFVLLDRDARPRAGLSLLPDGQSGVGFLDGDGTLRALLGFGASSTTGLALLDQEGTPRALLALSPDGTPALVFSDKDGEARAALGLQTDGTPRLLLGERP